MKPNPKDIELLFDQVSDLLTRVAKLRDETRALNCSPIIKETELYRAAASLQSDSYVYMPEWEGDEVEQGILVKVPRETWDNFTRAVTKLRTS